MEEKLQLYLLSYSLKTGKQNPLLLHGKYIYIYSYTYIYKYIKVHVYVYT